MVCKSNFLTVSFYLPIWQAFIYFYYKTKSLKLQVLNILKFQLHAVIVSLFTGTFACVGAGGEQRGLCGSGRLHLPRGLGSAICLRKMVFQSGRGGPVAAEVRGGAGGWCWALGPHMALWAAHPAAGTGDSAGANRGVAGSSDSMECLQCQEVGHRWRLL